MMVKKVLGTFLVVGFSGLLGCSSHPNQTDQTRLPSGEAATHSPQERSVREPTALTAVEKAALLEGQRIPLMASLEQRYSQALCAPASSLPQARLKKKVTLEHLQSLDNSVDRAPQQQDIVMFCKIPVRHSEQKPVYSEQFSWMNKGLVSCFEVDPNQFLEFNFVCAKQPMFASCYDRQDQVCEGEAFEIDGFIEGCECRLQEAQEFYEFKAH